MSESIVLMGVAKSLKRPLDDLYDMSKSSVKDRLKKWKASSNVNNLYKKISTIQKVKTIWQVEKEVNLKTFYYPSKIIVGDKRIEVNKADKIPLDTNVVIQGTVGQGKSIFLRYICSQEIRQGNKIPVFIELRKIDDKTRLKDLVYSTLKMWGFDIDDALFDFFAKSGKFLFLLDGFDEIGSAYVQQVIYQLEEWSDRYEGLRVVVTSRPDSGIERSAHFRVFHLAPLSEEDQKGIIGKLVSTEEQRLSIIDAIQSSSNDIRGLLTTPLMMTLLIVAYKSSQKIPEQFSEFYEDLFQTLLVRHDKTKPGFSREKKCKVNERKLQEIFEVFCFFSSKYNYSNFSHEEIFKTSSEAVDAADAQCDPSFFIHDIVKLCCLVVEEGLEYHFVHKSVREFYSANFIKSRNDDFANKFYGFMLENDKRQQWFQELVFLSQIDKYRFSVYFLKPHIEFIAKKFNIDLGGDEDKKEISLADTFSDVDFEVGFRKEELYPGLVKYGYDYVRYFPGTYHPYDYATSVIFGVRGYTKYTPEQIDELFKYSVADEEFEGVLKIKALKYIEIFDLEDELISKCKNGAAELTKGYQELRNYIRKEQEKVSILDL